MAPRWTPHPPEVRAAALARYAAGEPVGEVARALGVARSRVIAWLQRAGTYQPQRPSTRTAAPSRTATPSPATPSTTSRAPLRVTLPSGAIIESWDGAELGALLAVLDG